MAATGGRVRKTGTTLTIVAMLATGLSLAITSPAEARKRNVKRVAYAPPAASIVVDVKTGRVLHGQNEDAPRIPASITKVMTLYLLFEQLERGRLQLDSELRVSANAAAQAPSKLGLRAGSTIEVEDAIKALVTKSANDVATVVAENIGGSEEEFARMMTARARSIGMGATTFRNPHGLPSSPPNMTTARDLATLGRAIQDRFPRYYAYFGTRVFHFGSAAYANHNRLLGRVEGVDGIKTGYTRASGFNLLTSARTDDRHVVAVVLGGRSGASRDAQMASLIENQLPRAYAGRRTAPAVAEAPLERPRPAVVAAAGRSDTTVTTTAATATTSPPRATSAAPAAAEAQRPPLDLSSLRPVQASMAPVPAPSGTPLRWTPGAPAAATASADDAAKAALSPVAADKPADKEQPKVASTGPVVTTIAKTQPKPAVTAWTIQLGAAESEAKARAILDNAKAKSARVLTRAVPYTEKIEKGGDTLFRARFSGFQEADEAQAACKQLKRSGFACFATRG